jgi:molecular chaperone GrpE
MDKKIMDKKTTETRADSDAFELDLEAASQPLDQVIEEAVAAIDRSEGKQDDADSTEVDANAVERIAELEAETLRLRERVARGLADFENFRKRSEREKSDIRRYALTNPLRDFLDVTDNIERAMAAPGGIDDLKLGLEMTMRQFEELLRRYGVERVTSEGKPFDPNVHEAVSREESDAVQTATVGTEMQKGFTLHDRLLRPARVIVLVPKAVSEESGDDKEANEG